MKRFGIEFQEVFEDLRSYPDVTPQLGAPWLAYVAWLSGRPVVDWYLEERGWSLTKGEVEWLEWQRASWLSIWEVVAVEPGRGLELRDALTGESRKVHEIGGSASLEPHLMLLARVVDAGSLSLLCGVHPSPLGPLQAGRVVEAIRRKVRRKGVVPPERLRPDRIAWGMLQAWSEEVNALRTPPRLTNTDGDPLLLTEDRWAFDPARRSELLERLRSLENVRSDEANEGVVTVVRAGNRVHKEWENTILAHIEATEAQLVASTRSPARTRSAP